MKFTSIWDKLTYCIICFLISVACMVLLLVLTSICMYILLSIVSGMGMINGSLSGLRISTNLMENTGRILGAWDKFKVYVWFAGIVIISLFTLTCGINTEEEASRRMSGRED